MGLWTVILSIIGVASCAYFFGTRKYNHFKKLGIPHLKPFPVLGNLTGIFFNVKGLHDVLQESYECHPDAKYVGFYDFTNPAIILKDPELLKSIAIEHSDTFPDRENVLGSLSEPLFRRSLLALKGDEWKGVRALLTPAFTSNKMKWMFKTMSQCAIDFTDQLAEIARQREDPELDMKDKFGRYALDVIASLAFGLSVNSMKDPDNYFYLMGKKVADFSNLKLIKFLMLKNCPSIARFLNIRFLDSETSEYFANVIESTIATRNAEGIVRPDMIHLMMHAGDRKERSALSKEDMAAQAFVFFLGGFENPASTMSFAAYSLALNPDVQRKLQIEIDQVLEKSSGEVSFEDLHAMKYLDAVISETLRMFPPVTVVDRIGPKSFTLPPALPGLEPVPIKPGQTILIPVYSFHRNPRHFPDPGKFDPERFSDKNKSKISPYTYIPFGLGPRVCIGYRFTLMEVKLVLFYLLAKFHISTTPKTPASIKISKNSFAMEPEGGSWLKIEPRS